MESKLIDVIVSQMQIKELCVESEVGNPRHPKWDKMRIICASES